MTQELRSYERLSPELSLLDQRISVDTTNDGLITDYLVTGARGWDWLCQLYPGAMLLDQENMVNHRLAADDLIEYPSIIQVFSTTEGDKANYYFLTIELGEDADAIVAGIEKRLKAPNVIIDEFPFYFKHTLKLDIPATCENPEAYLREVVETFCMASNMDKARVGVSLNIVTDEVRAKLIEDVKDINILGGYPIIHRDTNLDVKAQYPETYTLANTTAERLVIEVETDCENPEETISRAIDLFCEKHPSMSALIPGHKEQWIKRIMDCRFFEDLKVDGGTLDYPVDELLAMDPPKRGCLKNFLVCDDPAYLNNGEKEVADLNKAPKVELSESIACPKVKYEGIRDTDVVAVDMVAEYTPFIRKWAEDRNIIGGGSTTLDQFIKGLTEAGELWTHIGKGQRELIQDDLGDVYVCLVNAAGNFDIKLEEHIRPLTPYNIHSGRQLYQRRGLKRYSLQVLYGLAAVSQSIENVLEADNERDVEFFKTDFCEACADVVYALETIALEHGWSLSDCVIAAYEDIRDRKGLMVNGTFIKEKDFTGEMVKAALDDERVKDETKVYLREWLLKQAGPIGGALATESTGDEPVPEFWKAWNDATGNVRNEAPYELTEQAIALSNKRTGDQFTTVLGLFGKPNHNGDVFVITHEMLKSSLDTLKGRLIGEFGNPVVDGNDHVQIMQRLNLTLVDNAVGTLVDYAINDLGDDSVGSVFEVVGLIEPSKQLKSRVYAGEGGHFGIRAITSVGTDNMQYKHVAALLAFDLHVKNPREMK
ncbi:hypothetical protein pEaSNUABM37_00081 [Erwinia phage pEa_SNUABM_37]|nr:hypothetical protein pEaSNUABM37_00081 [Erwinia phage pEa_SNUABM_37]QXO10551.1 hypothetical protein pEaSNUABM48_00081 [Erwinia phage pEa_SNUABM_48]